MISAVSFGVFYYTTARQIGRISGLGPVHVTTLAIVIIYHNASDKYFGKAFQFPVLGSIDLQHQQTYQVNTTLTLSSSISHSIDSATLAYSDGFLIQAESPNLPLTVTPGSSVTLTVILQAPNYDYSGPVTIDLLTH